MKRRVLYDLFPVRQPADFLHEVLHFLGLDENRREGALVGKAFRLALRLYQGRQEGFRECDTRYHDFRHAAETFLAMGRLLHGACLKTDLLTPRDSAIGLVAAIMHDTGYIRKADEPAGQGAWYRSEHEARSMRFVSRHGEALGMDAEALADGRLMIQGTKMAQEVDRLTYRSPSQELRVRMLSVADLLAQLSGATYLERLAYLFEEDQSADKPSYRDILDCYRKAIRFDDLARRRIATHLPQTENFLSSHFAARWNTPANLYRISMDRQINFLIKACASRSFNPLSDLRRWGSLDAEQRYEPRMAVL